MKSIALLLTVLVCASVFAAAWADPPASRPGRAADIEQLRKLARASTQTASAPASSHNGPTGVAALRREAADMELLVQSDLARAFIHATAELPKIAPRTIYRTKDRTGYYTAAQADALSA